jgi:hypothetical protein
MGLAQVAKVLPGSLAHDFKPLERAIDAAGPIHVLLELAEFSRLIMVASTFYHSPLFHLAENAQIDPSGLRHGTIFLGRPRACAEKFRNR